MMQMVRMVLGLVLEPVRVLVLIVMELVLIVWARLRQWYCQARTRRHRRGHSSSGDLAGNVVYTHSRPFEFALGVFFFAFVFHTLFEN
jgi:hypothetical protein